MENRELLQAIRAMIQEEMEPLKADIADLKTTVSNLEGQTKENTEIIKAIQHSTEVLNAKIDGLTVTTASKDAVASLDAKFDVLNNRLFQQEAAIHQLKAIK